MDLSDGVAARLAAVCLDDEGRLREYDIWDTAARGALLVDLVRAGRLTDDPDSIGVDPTPTGFVPADRLLAAMEVEPERPLTWWIDHGGVRLDDVADACVEAGRWTVDHRLLGRRFDVVAVERAVADQGLDETPLGDLSPETAAVAVLAIACGARGHRPEPVSDAELAPIGPLRWICETVTAHLELTHRHNLRSAGAADGGMSPYF
jgi:hypothetical protein